MPGYNLYYCNSKTSAGGSAIYVSDNIKYQPLSKTKIKIKDCEDVWVELTLKNMDTLIVGSVYRHPNNTANDIKTFEDAFISIIKSFKTYQKYLVMGDFNIHYDKIDTSMIMLIALIVLVAYNLLTNRQEYVLLVVPQLITLILMPHVLVTYPL